MRIVSLVLAVACSRAAGPVAAPPPHPTPRPSPRGPAIIATGQRNPDELVVDGENVYWAAGDSIWRAPLGDGPAQQVAGPLGGDILAMAGDATTLYVTLDGSGYHTLPQGRGKLVAIAKDGGAMRTLAEDLTWAPAIAVDEHDVFVGNTFDSIGFGTPTGQVRAYPKAGGAARMLATTETTPAAIAVDGDAVYWANYGGDNEVRRVDKRGGTVTLLAKELGTPAQITLTADAVLVATVDVGLLRIPKAGGQVATLLAGEPMAVCADATTAYVRTRGSLVLAVPLGGGPTHVVGTAPTMFYESIAIAGDDLYWTSRDKSTVGRAPRGGGPIHVAAVRHTPGAVAAAGDRVYYFDTDSGAHGDFIQDPQPDLLYEVPRDGTGMPHLVHTTPRERSDFFSAVAVDAGALYVTDPGAKTVLVMPRTGGTPEVIDRGGECVVGLATDLDAIYVADCMTGVHRVDRADHAVHALIADPVRAMVVAGDAVFAITNAAIVRTATTGGPAEVFVQQTQVAALAADATHLYWTIGRTVFRTTLAPPHALDKVATLPPIDGDSHVHSMVIDRGVLYVASDGAEDEPGEVLRVDPDGTVTSVLDDLGQTSNLVLSDGDVYFASTRRGALLRVAP